MFRVAGVEIGIATAYFRPADTEGSLQLLEEISTWLRMLRGPYLVYADWNVEPGEDEATSRLQLLQGTYIVPEDTVWTCSSGSKRLLDYVLASQSLAPVLRVV